MKGKFVLTLVGMLMASSGVAQIPSSSAEIRSNPASDAYSRGAIELKRLVACGIKRRPTFAIYMLTTRPGSSDEHRIAGHFRKVIENCMNNLVPAIWMDTRQMRGAIAEEFYLGDYPNDPDFSQLEHPPEPLPPAWYDGKLNEAGRLSLYGQQFASCVTAAQPRDVAAMLRSTPRSLMERAAIDRLMPSFGPCLDKGKSMRLDAAWLRAVAADALYRSVKRWQSVTAVAKEGGK